MGGGAARNKEALSPFIMIPEAAQLSDESLVHKKVEVRWLMEADEGEEEGGEVTTFLHCFEGTVLRIVPYEAGRKKKLNLEFGKHVPAALVRMDEIFNWPDVWIPLDLELYAKEHVHYGWNVMTDEYVRAYSTVTTATGLGDTDDDDDDSDISDSDSSGDEGCRFDCDGG